MSRKIKFRGLTKANNVMVFGDLYHCPGGSHRIFWYELKGEIPDVDYNSFDVLVQSSTVGEFTGLKDKNGVDIYEGDQLYVCAGYSSTVEFQNAMFVSVYKHPEDGEVVPLLDAIGKNTLVIGNIYQNPELLTSNKTQS